ncbi:MAG TPA: hypothetical protein VLT36_16400 [Candidatus Dormibacteraeota bacterium]|nr:hypothetical protein [Candidatus Dormibacteraeota bacterium]
MSIRAYALVDYRLPDYGDQPAVVSRLAPSLPNARAVGEYWRLADPDYPVDTAEGWTARLVHNPPEDDFLRYHGPGGFSIAFGERVARVSGICRWSGFVTIRRLQQVHATAFRSIARALGGTRIVLIPEYDPVNDIGLYGNGSLGECIDLLQQRWGAPHPTTDIVTDDVEVYYRRQSPVWYVETLSHDG